VLLNAFCKSRLNRLDAKVFAVRTLSLSFCFDLQSKSFYVHLFFRKVIWTTWFPFNSNQHMAAARPDRSHLGMWGVLSLKRFHRHVLHIAHPIKLV